MKVATYNIHACIGTDGLFSPHRIAQVLKEIDADVVALQEVENPAMDDLTLLENLAAEAQLQAIAGPTIELPTRHYGNAVLTRLPIVEIRKVDLSLPKREPRGALDVTLDWGGRHLQVVATHLGLSPAERRQQVLRVIEVIDGRRADSSLLLGDINEWALWGRPIRWLRRRFAPTPTRPTWPSRLPVFALDRIWATPRSALTDIATHSTRLARIASDHLPLTAELN